jgi:hypothetical protein
MEISWVPVRDLPRRLNREGFCATILTVRQGMGLHSSVRYEEDQAFKMAGKAFIFFYSRNIAQTMLLRVSFLGTAHDFLQKVLK